MSIMIAPPRPRLMPWLITRICVVVAMLCGLVFANAFAPATTTPLAVSDAPTFTVTTADVAPVHVREPMQPPSGGDCMQPASGSCVVPSGSTLSRIGAVQGIPWTDLQAWNGISRPENLRANQDLSLVAPAGGDSTNAVPASNEAPPAAAPTSTSVQDRIIAEAWKFVGDGADWQMGGTTRQLRDCSRMLMFAMQDAGLNVTYRNSDALIAWAERIPRDQARPGDLVLRSGHAAIYAGNGMIIDHGSGNNGAKHQPIYWDNPQFYRVPANV